MSTGLRVIHALAAQPGGPQLLQLGGRREDIALVGGAVRDLLLGRAPRELDVVVGAGAPALARELAQALGASTELHERFGTALVQWPGGRIDIAERRDETYPAPGALPQVRPGSVEQDLRRRDFTVNAIAVALGGPRRGELAAAEHALEDLAAGRLRVLHERSFLDDPTRLLRLARYRARLRFDVEQRTAALAAGALAAGALATVSRARIGAELRLALREADAPAALDAMDQLGLLAALHPRMRFDGALARRALQLLAAGEAASARHGGGAPAGDRAELRPDLLLLAVLLAPIAQQRAENVEEELRALLGDLEFAAADRDGAIHDAASVDELARRLAAARTPSQVYQAVSGASPQGVALAGAWGDMRAGGTGGTGDASGTGDTRDAGRAAREWLAELRDVRLQITGADLLAAGVPQGPEIRRRLHAALLLKLDGALARDGREAELSAALEARV